MAAGWPAGAPGAPWPPDIAAFCAKDGGKATFAAIAPAAAPTATPAATPAAPTPAAPGLMTLVLLLMMVVS
jgi:hypothetical protein